MKNKWIILSWILLFIFGFFYLLGVFIQNVNDEVIKIIQSSTDLWANLFASMIAVLFLDMIVKRTEIQKSQRSIKYVRGRILNAYQNLIFDLRLPTNWKEKINGNNLDLEEYFQRVSSVKEFARVKFDEIIDKFGGLIEPNIRNDIFDTIALLNMAAWSALEEPTRCRADKVWRLRNYANMIFGLSNTSKETIKRYKLLEDSNSLLVFRQGEPKLEESSMPGQAIEFQYLQIDGIVDEIRKLRDTVNEIS